MRTILCAIAATAALIAVATAAPLRAEPRARIAAGELVGRQQGPVAAFLGVPYAAPTAGPNRWRAPQPPAKWTGVRPATAFGPSCPQITWRPPASPWSTEYLDHTPISEDCLSVNVWTTARSGERLPVLVWIHGGGFVGGSSAVPIYDGRSLARQGVVVVSLNYRLGVFGFLALPELTQEAAGGPPANWGLQDIATALRWVRENIAAFGGDPSQVTVAGQSAGAMAIHDLLVSPLADGLFHRAIIQSGLPSDAQLRELAEAEQLGLQLQTAAGARSLTELRAKSMERLLEAAASPRFGTLPFQPVVDGVALPRHPRQLAAEGRGYPVPVLIGLTADEHSAMSSFWGRTDAESFERLFATEFGAMADRIEALYPAATPAARALASRQVLRDRGLSGVHEWARPRLEPGQPPTYVYLFDHAEPGPEQARWGAFHSSEIPYVFDTLDKAPARPFRAQDHLLAQTASRYWVNFVRTGDPNGADLPAWPALNAGNPEILRLGDPVVAQPLLPADVLRALTAYAEGGGELAILP